MNLLSLCNILWRSFSFCWATLQDIFYADVAEDLEVTKNCAYAVTQVEKDDKQTEIALTKNKAYVQTPIIPLKTNECYGTSVEDIDSDQFYSTVDVENSTSLPFEYDYVIQ